MESVGKEVITQQYGRFVTPLGIDRGGVATDHGLIQDIVVNQSGRVDHLHDRGQDGMGRAERAAGPAAQEHERRPEALSLVTRAVVDQSLHEGKSAAELVLEDSFGLGEFSRDRFVQIGHTATAFPDFQHWSW